MKIKNKSINKLILKLGVIVSFMLLFAVLVLSFIFPYDAFIDLVLQLVNYPSDKRDVLAEMINPSRLLILQGALLFGLLLIGFLFFSFDKVYTYIQKFIYYFLRAVKSVFTDFKTKKALLVLAIPIVSSIYLGLTIPVSYDEAFTFLNFTNKPFYYCMIFYPYPNNHVLHSLLTNITDCIPFLPTLFCLRLTAIISSILAWTIAYSFVKRFYSQKVAMFVVGIVSMTFMSVYFNFMARGYGMVTLFFIIALYASYNIIKNNNRTKDWLFFMVSSVLGFYTMPSFLYPFVILNALILIYNYRNIKKQIVYNVLTIASVILLYAPIMIVDGIKALTGNQFVEPKSRFVVIEALPDFFRETLQDIFGLPFFISIILILAGFVIAFKNKDKWTMVLWVLFLLAPVVLLIAHSVIPFPRTFVYYAFVLIFLIGVSIGRYIEQLPNVVLIIGVIVIQIISFVNFSRQIGALESFNTQSSEINNLVLKEKNKTYYIGPSYINFEFEFISRGYNSQDLTIDTNERISADTIRHQGYVIIDSGNDATVKRKVFFSNGYQNVYIEDEK
ncbi:glycosyltransferase family 39 protein [Dysgonomonas sp. ZJ279]|uniref:glycosyltransferase family 39 protein n=1 Tax=Dysgonomonas sp. ZJ279 TaxID=2709796 RepID=UPI0013EE39DA|nr:glycosyltransferase family 39 protein [Dysgonomonas sp. ZJ279]